MFMIANNSTPINLTLAIVSDIYSSNPTTANTKATTERNYALQSNGSTQGALLQTVTTTTSYDNDGNATRINSVTKNGSSS